MLNKVTKLFILFLTGFIICTCIDPFNPKIKSTEAHLVVDALLTNESSSCTVRLSRTTFSQNDEPEMISGAIVAMTDQNGIESGLTETSSGIYKSDSMTFRGVTGSTYTLHIRTFNGTEYKSEPCTMYQVDKIDSIYFSKDQEILNNNTEFADGIRIFLNSDNSGGSRYCRWLYDEWWKFSVPYPKKYNYVHHDSIPVVDTIKQICYKHNGSNEIIIHSSESSQSTRIERQPILFVASGKSDRLLKQYCINIKQLSLSPAEFQFWEQLKEINDDGGNIFDKQPFSLIGNIHNINDPSEIVLGYFQVSEVKEKRIYIMPAEINAMGLPGYSNDCEKIEIGPEDFRDQAGPDKDAIFDYIYQYFTGNGYTFTEPIYDLRFINLEKLVFTKPLCALCTTSGSLNKPDFWVDSDTP